MKRVIKAAEGPAFARAWPSPAPASRADQAATMELAAAQAHVDELAAAVERGQSEIERLRQDIGRAYREGEAEGRRAGSRDADQRIEERILALEAGIAAAQARFNADLAGLERLAALVASAALSRVLGDPGAQADLVRRIVTRQVEGLRALGRLQIEVSAQDFSESAQISDLSLKLRRDGLEIRACKDLPSGGCRIRLALGTLDVGVDQQWSRLKETLEELAEIGAEP